METKTLKPAWMYWLDSIILAILLVLVGIIAIAINIPEIEVTLTHAIGVILLVIGILIFFSVVMRQASWRYSYNDIMVETRRGIITKHTSQIDLKDVENIKFSQGIFERIFGLGTIGFASAGTGRIEVVFEGIPNAKTIKQELDTLIHNVKEGISGKKKCPQCSEMVQVDAKVCRFCGYKFEE